MEPAKPASPSRRTGPPPRRALVAVAVAVAVVLAGGVATAAVRLADDEEPAPAASSPSSTTAPPTTVAPDDPAALALEAAAAELSGFVEAERDRRFEEPVDVELLDGQAFRDRLLEDVEEQRDTLAKDEAVLTAFGLLDSDVDLFETFNDLLSGAVLGFYDPETGELVVRGGEITPLVRTTLVHELTHALDDQLFELERPELDDARDERALAFASVVEGNALRIETAYEATLSQAERDAALAAELSLPGAEKLLTAPAIVTSLLTYPYIVGPGLVDALVGAGGEDRVDSALREPPATSEQVADPAAYLEGEGGVVEVETPEAGGDVTDQGSYGAFLLEQTLAVEIDPDAAAEAAEGWGGDAYASWEDDDRSCVRAAFAMDTDADLAELEDAWRAWASERDDAEVVRGDERVTVTSCV